MGEIDIIGSNATYSYSFSFTRVICTKYLQINVWHFHKNVSHQYKIFFVDLYAYFILFCKTQTCNAQFLFLGFSHKYTIAFSSERIIWLKIKTRRNVIIFVVVDNMYLYLIAKMRLNINTYYLYSAENSYLLFI